MTIKEFCFSLLKISVYLDITLVGLSSLNESAIPIIFYFMQFVLYPELKAMALQHISSRYDG